MVSGYWTPAHYAVEREDAEALASLLARADPELADPDGRTPRGMATFYDHDLAVRLLRTHISKRACGSR
ncbi:hypothetical protein [Streptomyces sp. NBC_00094]|uniref:hypothetical protein n=1 Tax=Streptomyces sp. NBC_00094 TaxID=2903620 RepID=UPI00224D2BA9|nr:hypothetical protein [Streptomyces sp. NBC_00094]MCX5393723.1 ankyrin repeat domain-containing protein [Streptomyces sp. NBC_00094]